MKSYEPTINLNSLSDDLLVEITSCIASSSLSSFNNLRLVSKPFKHICNEPYVLYRLSLQELPLFSWSRNPQRLKTFSNFIKRCRKNGNPEALYRIGLIKYFIENQKRKGLKYLSETARKGNQEAMYLYGMILICLGGNTKQQGFKILSGLISPLMSKTMEEVVEVRNVIRDRLWWRGRLVMIQLKRSYVKEKCECDGKTKTFLVKNCVWNGYGEEDDMNTSCCCEFCLWDYEVESFFYDIE